ncbi:hypothetical protein CUMW_034780 [Citrus unshiu]|nr:hypothetical protein CUMW_034780 [Citrus unshiu]
MASFSCFSSINSPFGSSHRPRSMAAHNGHRPIDHQSIIAYNRKPYAPCVINELHPLSQSLDRISIMTAIITQ